MSCHLEEETEHNNNNSSRDSSVLIVEKPPSFTTTTTAEDVKGELEFTIDAMMMTMTEDDDDDDLGGLCAHPRHYHSFQQVHLLLSSQTCHGCHERLARVMMTPLFGGRTTTDAVVRCLACNAYAHRRCALQSPWSETLWKDDARNRCTVNRERLREIQSQRHWRESKQQRQAGEECPPKPQQQQEESNNTDDDDDDPFDSGGSSSLEWTTEGPPEHWASVDPKPLAAETTTTDASLLDRAHDEQTCLLDKAQVDDDDGMVNVPLHYVSHPFASVSRALQENVLAHFRNTRKGGGGDDTTQQAKTNNTQDGKITDSNAAVKSENPKNDDNNATSKNTPRDDDDGTNPVVQFVNGTVRAVRTTVAVVPRRMGAAAVAGGIAGGVAGMALAGPAGALAGYGWGRAAGVLGVLVEGSVSVGVLVAGVATGSAAGTRIHERIVKERRVLEMGEHGASRKVLLVRPNIKIDARWEVICAEATKTAPQRQQQQQHNKNNNPLGLFSSNSASRDRHCRDEDIIQPTEEEIPTHDKVFLLVSRILNDKDSLPGHIYRSLIARFFERVQSRKELDEEGYADSEISGRTCRDDTHAIIKFVTATLLDARPGLDASPAMTELAATAVESLVFGKVYDEVIGEIVEETSEKDASLLRKIEHCEQDAKIRELVSGNISEKALRALRRLSTAHSAVDKLEDCVQFLESISEHFSTSNGSREGLCADSLLKMVCQHILMARVERLNAEIMFLEEFARDEQLLRGREGYSLVTLQAALHFLNMCENVEALFEEDDDEEILPLNGSSDLDDSVEIL